MNTDALSIASSDLNIATPGPLQLFAGSPAQAVTMPETIAQNATVISQFSPLTRDGTSGKFKVATIGDKVTAIAPYDIDATAGDVIFSVYKAAYFNTKAIAWPAAFNTELSKRVATDGTPIFHRDIVPNSN